MTTDRLARILNTEQDDNSDVIPNDILSDVECYLQGVVDALLDEFESSEDDAVEFMFDVIDDLVEDGVILDFPGENASDEDVDSWLEAAKDAGLQGYVIAAAEVSSEDDEEEE